MAHSQWRADAATARHYANESILGDDGRPYMVCVGMALRRGYCRYPPLVWSEWSCVFRGGDDRSNLWVDFAPVRAARGGHACDGGAAGVIAGRVHDSFAGAPACLE